MGARIKGVSTFRTRLPLARPYHLSLVTLNEFDSVLIRIRADGIEGSGEITNVPGYFHQTPEDVWDLIEKWAPGMIGQSPELLLREISKTERPLSFAITPLLTALEELVNRLNGGNDKSIRIPILGVVQGETIKDLVTDAERLQEQGFATLKFKVGFDVDQDLERLKALQMVLRPGVQVRVDANQGYDYGQAARFLNELDPGGIELLEQPLAPDAWEEMSRLSRIRSVPLMLDEAISSEADLDRAIENECAQAVKFKLMKCGSRAELARLINKAQNAEFKVIVGNGVALDIGCRHEALVLHETGLIREAGEMNGFLKCKEHLLEPELKMVDGDLIVPGGTPTVRWDVVSRFAVENKIWGRI